MKKVIVWSVVLLMVSGISQAKGEEPKEPVANTSVISGTVTDHQTGELLVGVSVSVEGTELKTYTDFEGRFTIRGIKPGTYSLCTSIISYEKLTVNDVNVEAGSKKELTLSLSSEK